MNEKYPLALPEGTVLAGQYIIERVLGQGGFGITYEALDHKTNARVAVKEYFPDAMATRTGQTTVVPFAGEKGEHYTYGKTCFLQEAETLAKFIGNENIVRIYSYFEENETAYFVMDFIEGTSFDEYLKDRGGKIPYEEAAQILLPVMDALNVVHSKGIVHRDVTPDNIYITKDGVVKLLDFGAARYSLGDQSRSLDVILKHGFAPKEQYTRRGKQGPYTDIYALGATFYFALTGKRPPDSVERLDEDDLVPPTSLGVQLSGPAEDAILKALNVQPADRFQSMAAFKNALLGEQAAAPQPIPAAVGGAPAGVVQTYFEAPAQAPATPAAPPAGGAVPPVTSPAGGAVPPVPGPGAVPPTQGGQNKKLLMIGGGIAAAVLVLVIGLFVFVFGGKKDPVTADKPTPDPTWQVTAEPTPSSFIIQPTAEPTPEPTPEPTADSTGDFTVIGNSAQNLMNLGIRTSADGEAYILEDDAHSLLRLSDKQYLAQNESGLFSNLVLDNGRLLCLYEGSAFYYDDQNQQFQFVPELKDSFAQSIQSFLLTQDYYVVCCLNNEGTSTVYRVTRSTGQVAACCTIPGASCFTLSNDGWLYYSAKDADDLSHIYRMWLDTLQNANSYLVAMDSNTNAIFCNLTVVGDYLYYGQYDEVKGTCIISRMNRESGYDKTDPDWVISNKLDIDLNSGCGFGVFPKNHIIYFFAVPSGSDAPNLYEIRGNDDGTFDTQLVSENSCLPNLFFLDGGNYKVCYLHKDADSGLYQVYSKTFDAEGNQIKT